MKVPKTDIFMYKRVLATHSTIIESVLLAFLLWTYYASFKKENGKLTLVSLSKAAFAELIPPPYLHIRQFRTLSMNKFY